MTWDDVKRISALAHETQRRGFKFTHLVTIMPDVGGDMERKRDCARIVGHLGQALKRRGRQHVGLTVYEKSDGADLHAHHVVHIPKGEQRLVERLHNPPKIDVRRSVPAHLGYVTKQRRPLPPELERQTKHQRKKGGLRIPGKRWTATSAARALIEDQPSAANSSFRASANLRAHTPMALQGPIGEAP